MAIDIGHLAEQSQSLELDASIRSGLTAITVLAFISFFSSTALFLYLGYKLIWHMYIKKPRAIGTQQQQQPQSPLPEDHPDDPKAFQIRNDFALGIDGVFSGNESDSKSMEAQRRGSGSTSKPAPRPNNVVRAKRQPPNQFLILIFNLLLADMHQGVAFFLNAEWLRYGAVRVGTPACFAQGFFVSTGDLASSCFITTIAIHTYLSIVRRVKMSYRLLYTVIACVWVFVYLISGLPVAATHNGAFHGGFFVRAGAWCWMNIEYPILRLVTHYLFIFIAIAITTGLYTAIFIHLRSEARGSSTRSTSSQLDLSHNPAFLIYPVIYVVCTLPLALGRIASMAGADPPLGYMCFAGALISTNGMFDCMLFGTTRNVIVFASKHDVDYADTGLTTFNFMQTPSSRRYGNMVWVQGGGPRIKPAEDKTTGGWWSWQKLGGGGESSERARGHRRTGSRSVSQESLRGPAAIQMDTVTTVVVEMDSHKDPDSRYPNPAASDSPSVTSTEKAYPRAI